MEQCLREFKVPLNLQGDNLIVLFCGRMVFAGTLCTLKSRSYEM
jgi:hypothetical protein